MSLPNTNAVQSLRPAMSRLSGEPATEPFQLAGLSSPLSVVPQACSCAGKGTCSCGKGGPPSYVYAVGAVRPVFPSLSVEKEFYQAVDGRDFTKTPDNRLIYETLGLAENLYIAREMCWVLQKGAGKIDYFILKPRSSEELTGLIGAIAPREDADFDLIVGVRGPVASPEVCNGLQLPVIICNEAFDFTDKEMICSIVSATGGPPPDKPGPDADPCQDGATEEQATDVFWEIIKLTNNTGDTDEYRAINFLATRYMGIYQTTYLLKYHAGCLIVTPDPNGYSLSSVVSKPALVQGTRKILDVIFAYRGNSSNATLQWYCSVDVSGQFPFLVTRMTRYYGYY